MTTEEKEIETALNAVFDRNLKELKEEENGD